MVIVCLLLLLSARHLVQLQTTTITSSGKGEKCLWLRPAEAPLALNDQQQPQAKQTERGAARIRGRGAAYEQSALHTARSRLPQLASNNTVYNNFFLKRDSLCFQ